MGKSNMKRHIADYIENSNLNQHSCKSIRQLEVQVIDEFIDKETYANLAYRWGLKAPFELLSRDNKIHKKELKICLLLFSIDTYENKLELFQEMTQKDPRAIMHFIEWRNELVDFRIPTELEKSKIISPEERQDYIQNKRLASGKEVNYAFESYKINEADLKTLDFISV